jgi:hypothetical protein
MFLILHPLKERRRGGAFPFDGGGIDMIGTCARLILLMALPGATRALRAGSVMRR